MSKGKNEKEKNTEIQTTTSRPSLGIDVEYYQCVIDDPEVSEERKRELIETIGSIIVQCIDLGFGVHPVQLVEAEKKEHLKLQTKPEKEKVLERSDV